MDDGESRQAMRPLDSLLLGSFPAPPTHIPASPASANPPPSRPPSSPLPPLPARRRDHRPNESISSIDVRDILQAATWSDDDDARLPLLQAATWSDDDDARLPPRARALSVADPIDPQTTIPRSFTFPSPRRTVFSPSSPPRSPSPDIPAIISATPRPRASSLHKSKHPPRRVSQGLPYLALTASSPYGLYRHSDAMDTPTSDDDDTRSWIDHDEFGHPLPPPPKSKPVNDWSPEEERRFAQLERQLEASDSDASDSSLDLHTPLPHLMMRHGLLSPQSRLITQPSARDSVVSLASSTTSKSSRPLKDARDTVKRRVRHRDGRLLRGGIGLTTGLGWSDSEDEGAPSALTRRISSLNLSVRSSASSLALSCSTTPSRSSSSSTSDLHASLPARKSSSASSRPFARSYSSTTTSLRMSDLTPDVDEFGKISSQRSPIPRKPRTPKLSVRTPGSARAIPEGEETDESMDTFSRYTAGSNTMLTASPDMTLAELEGGGARLTREKSLPPLPRSSVAMPPPPPTMGTSRSMGAIAVRRGSGRSSTGATEGRARSISGASSASRGSTASKSTQGSSIVPPSSVKATITKATSPTYPATGASMVKTPRPLRLTSPPATQTHLPTPLLLAQRQQQHDRPAVPVPGIGADPHARSPLIESRYSLPSSPSTPSTPSPVTPGTERRPRVGTGMTYRSSASSSRMRASSSIKSTAAMQKPIPL
ncbi:hypothetical protein C0995_016084 [Termitomyces sp. Mi166|nr:hypothetical protein C0995_016084 [Termitomyces sp. Mi166\